MLCARWPSIAKETYLQLKNYIFAFVRSITPILSWTFDLIAVALVAVILSGVGIAIPKPGAMRVFSASMPCVGSGVKEHWRESTARLP